MSLQDRSEMRRCGRRYASEGAALHSKRGLSGNYLAAPCRCEGWHLHEVKSAPARGVERMAARAIIRDTLPPLVRAQVDSRDALQCVHCGAMRGLQRHHRRVKGMGGDTRAHTDCACNVVLLCAACHYWAHVLDQRSAAAEGLLVPRAAVFPGAYPVMVHSASGSGALGWPTCDGAWASCPPTGAEVVA